MANFHSEAPQSNDDRAPAGGQTDARPLTTEPRLLPPWKVLLHNDDVNAQEEVVLAILTVTNLKPAEAIRRMLEAHHTGVALLLTTHRERAELYLAQFSGGNLTVTIEPAG